MSESEMSEKPRSKRGFASMDPALVREHAKRGGVAAHAAGTAYKYTPETAQIAGRKGGRAVQAKKRALAAQKKLEEET